MPGARGVARQNQKRNYLPWRAQQGTRDAQGIDRTALVQCRQGYIGEVAIRWIADSAQYGEWQIFLARDASDGTTFQIDGMCSASLPGGLFLSALGERLAPAQNKMTSCAAQAGDQGAIAS